MCEEHVLGSSSSLTSSLWPWWRNKPELLLRPSVLSLWHIVLAWWADVSCEVLIVVAPPSAHGGGSEHLFSQGPTAEVLPEFCIDRPP